MSRVHFAPSPSIVDLPWTGMGRECEAGKSKWIGLDVFCAQDCAWDTCKSEVGMTGPMSQHKRTSSIPDYRALQSRFNHNDA